METRPAATTLRTLMRLAFWAALAVTLWFAWTPQPPTLIANDKSQHALAFCVLTLLYLLAYPGTRRPAVFAGLAALGGIIELVQAIPALHRDADVHDWLADIAAVGVTLACASIVRSGYERRRPR